MSVGGLGCLGVLCVCGAGVGDRVCDLPWICEKKWTVTV